MIKCIIFDCDGTLVDSEHLFNRALSDKLAELNICLSPEILLQRFRGIKFRNLLKALEDEYLVTLDDEFTKDYRLAVDALFVDQLVACSGVVETLARIDLAVCVASNGPLKKIKLALSVTGLADRFGANVFSAYEVNAWKPEPELFLYAAKKMSVTPSECLVVEDSLVGVEAALTAGMKAVLYDPQEIQPKINGVKKIKYFSEVLNHC